MCLAGAGSLPFPPRASRVSLSSLLPEPWQPYWGEGRVDPDTGEAATSRDQTSEGTGQDQEI